MATTTKTIADNSTFDRTVADLKQGVDYATRAQASAAEKAMKATKDYIAFNQASLEAVTQASKIFADGTQDLLRQAAASSQSALAEVLSGWRALLTAKSVKEGIELQVSQARASANWSVNEATRFAQASIALVEKASAPLTARAMVAAESIEALKA